MIIYYRSKLANGIIFSIETDVEIVMTFSEWLDHFNMKKERSWYINPYSEPAVEGVLKFVCSGREH